ncbi:MAG: hypothetical protein Q7W30_06700 [Coriobacteriia bacterium]|nr:hypothetical protein [Coriobacteriia bacterium]
MNKSRIAVFATATAMIPSIASATEGFPATSSDWIALTASALTLVAAVALMVLSLRLRGVSRGSVLADNITYVVAACLCLAASVLASWIGMFLTDPLSASQASIGASFLIFVGLVLLCVYFWRVHAALSRFMTAVTGEGARARKSPDGDGDA